MNAQVVTAAVAVLVMAPPAHALASHGAKRPVTRPRISVKAPTPRRPVSGLLSGANCQARVRNPARVAQVVFTVDGRRLRARRLGGRHSGRWTCAWNSSTARNGRHTLRATAYDVTGRSGSTALRVTVRNLGQPVPAKSASTASTVSEPVGSGVVPAAFTPATISGSTYYVSASGSDANAGTSPASAWRTVARANRASLRPGDGILFDGGQAFSDDALMPASSGVAGTPIVYGSYGTGKATLSQGVWFRGSHDLVFQDLALTNAGQGINATGDRVTVQGVSIANVTVGINASGSGWLIQSNTIDHTGDSGMLVDGDAHTITGNLITNTGTNPGITYGKHGIYLKATNTRITNNTISHMTGGSGVSVRYRNSTVEHNTISDGPGGISWFQYDTVSGTSSWRYNAISATSEYGIYVSRDDKAGPTIEHFTIADNTLSKTSGASISLDDNPSLNTVANNRLAAAS
jgi:hypothetical protein